MRPGKRAAKQQPNSTQAVVMARNGAMHTRQQHGNGSTSSRQHKRIAGAAGNVLQLPVEVLQVIGSKLAVKDVISARSTCKLWAQHVSLGMQHVTTRLHPDSVVCSTALAHIKRLMPMASSFTLHISPRSSQPSAHLFLTCLASYQQLSSLEFHITHVAEDKWPPVAQPFKKFDLLSQYTKLTSLSFIGGPCPCDANDLAGLTALTRLTSLIIRPMVAGTSNATGPIAVASMGLNVEQVTAIGSLVSLRCLELPLSLNAATEAVTALGNLTQLTRLVTHGCPIGFDTAAECMQLWKRLPNLKEVATTVPAESPRVPQHLGLDMLPGLKQLSFTYYRGDAPPLQLWATKFCRQLTKLVLRTQGLSEGEVAVFMQMRALQHLEMQTGNAAMPYSSVMMAVHELPKLHTLICVRPLNSQNTEDQGLHAGFTALASGLQHSLERLELEGVVATDFHTNTLAELKRCIKLHTLALKCTDHTTSMLPINLTQMPASLRVLKLRFAVLQGCSPKQGRPPPLNELQLIGCTLPDLRNLKTFISGVQGLSSLHLESMQQLKDEHISKLACLTGLTSLAVLATTNQNVTSAALGTITNLTSLTRLTWHVGDMLDITPDPLALRSFSRLLVLSVTGSMYWRLMRWNVLSVMEYLPYCQLETDGP